MVESDGCLATSPLSAWSALAIAFVFRPDGHDERGLHGEFLLFALNNAAGIQPVDRFFKKFPDFLYRWLKRCEHECTREHACGRVHPRAIPSDPARRPQREAEVS